MLKKSISIGLCMLLGLMVAGLVIHFSVVSLDAIDGRADPCPEQDSGAVGEPICASLFDEDVDRMDTGAHEGLSTEEWNKIQTMLQKAKYYPTWHEVSDGFVASNPGHHWHVTFSEGAAMITPSSGEDWSWLVVPSGYGYENSVYPLSTASDGVVEGNRIEFAYDNDLVCWYVNDREGLEHGFTIAAPPQPRTNGDLIIEMSLDMSLTPKAINDGKDILFLEQSGEKVLNYGKLLVTDATGHSIPSSLHISADSTVITITIDDSAAVYPITVDPLMTSEIIKLTASDGTSIDQFGYSVSVDGDTVVIGARGDDAHRGSAYVFARNQDGADSWGEVTKFTGSNVNSGDQFGYSVSISGDTVVVGAHYYGQDHGAAYVFERNHGGMDNWGQVRILMAIDGENSDDFGSSVSISGDTIVVGAERNDKGSNTNQGSAYVYERNKGGADYWGEVAKLFASDGGPYDHFGKSISISGDTIVVGAPGDGQGTNSWRGSVYLYERNEGGADNWGQVAKWKAFDGVDWDNFGHSVSIDGDIAVVGVVYDDVDSNANQGSAFIYKRVSADAWWLVKMLTASDGEEGDCFGRSVSVDGDTIVVGAESDNVSGNSTQGSAYVFSRNQGGADNWGEVTKLTASDGTVDDQFGFSVSINGNMIVIGAYADNISGNNFQGSAYTFMRTGDVWLEKSHPIASDGATDDRFGWSISIDGDTMVVGAYWGEIGGQNIQGSAYVFERNHGGIDKWGEVTNLTASDGIGWDEFGRSVSISGGTIVIGAPGRESVYIFKRSQIWTNKWDEVIKLTASDGAPDDNFGYSVSISGDTIVVGAYNHDVGSNASQGSAYVFERNHGGADNWGEVAKLTASDGAPVDVFGVSVAIDVDTVVVAANRDDVGPNDQQGSAYIFERNQGGADNWGEVAKLTASDGAADDLFGVSVAIKGDTVVVGAYDDDIGANTKQGSAYVFKRNQGGADNWGEVAKLTASDGAIDDYFGASVSIDVDVIVIGAMGDDVWALNQGSVYVFERNQGGMDDWGEVTNITASDGELNDYFGVAVSISGKTVVVGASNDDNGTNSDQGSSYVYRLTTLTVPPTITTPDNATAIEDSPYSVDYNASDPDKLDMLTWGISFTDTDGWLTIDPSTGILSGMPDNTDVGNWTVNVTVDDGNGGIDWSNFTLIVVNVDPIITTADNPNAIEDVPYYVNYNSEDDGQGIITWSVDSNGTWLCIDPQTGVLSGTPTNDDVGTCWVNVSVSDGNGGSDCTNFTIIVFNMNDDPAIITSDVTIAIEDIMYSVDYNGTDIDPTSDTLTWALETNATWLTIDPGTGILNGTPTNDDVGVCWVNVSVSDGNWGSDWTNFTVTVFNVNDDPVITTTDDTTALEDSLYSIDYNATDPDVGDALTWNISYTDTDGWFTIDPNTGVISGTPDNTDVGSWIVNVSVVDGNGGITWSNFTLTVSNASPSIITVDDTIAIEDVLYSVDYNSDDDGQGIITWSVNSNATWLFVDSGTGVLSGTPTNDDVGTIWVNVSVFDGNGGSNWTNFTVTVSNVNDEPMIVTLDNTTATEDIQYSVDYDATDIDPVPDTLTWALDTNATWLSMVWSTGVLTGTPGNGDVGPFWVNVSVSDGNGGNDWTNFIVTVCNVNDDPKITTLDDTTAREETQYSMDYNATDIDPTSDTFTWILITNATWLSIDSGTGILSGTPTNDDVGTCWVNVSVFDDKGGSDWTNFTVTVSNVNDNPVITTVDDTIAMEDNLYFVDYEVNDQDVGDIIEWSILFTNTDGWLTIDPSTGVLSGTPDNSDVGNWTVIMLVDDGKGGTDVHDFILTVVNVNDPPVIITEDVIKTDEDALYLNDYNAHDIDSGPDVLTWNLTTNAKGWLSIDPITGILSGVANNGNVGVYWVNVSVDDGNDGVDFHNFTLTIKNIPPIITTTNIETTINGSHYSVDYSSTDDGQGILTWNLITNAYTWLDINSETGILSGTPTNLHIGFYWVNISVEDGNGGKDSTNFTLTVLLDTDGDGTPDPSIWFDPSINHTNIPNGQTIQIAVTDPRIEYVAYSIDGGEYQILEAPYILYPYTWPEGAHIVFIKAQDLVRNEIIRWFEVKIDNIAPYITHCDPPLNARDVSDATNVVITFSEPMNTSNFIYHISISPSANFACYWKENSTILTISFSPEKLADGTTYTLKIDKQMADRSGNKLGSDFMLGFTTQALPQPGEPSPEPSSPAWIFGIVAVAIAIALLLLFISLRKRKGEPFIDDEAEVEFEAEESTEGEHWETEEQ